MANVYAVKTGNWSDTTVWNTGALPTTADDVYSNAFTVTINQDVTVLSIRSRSAAGISAGGGFILSTSNTVNLTSGGLIGGTGTCLLFNGGVGVTATLNTATLTGPDTNSSTTLSHGGVGTLTVSCTTYSPAGTGTSRNTITFTSTGTLNYSGGALTGVFSTTSFVITGTGTVNIVADVLGGSNTSGLNVSGNATINITGNIVGGSNTGRGILIGSTCTINITGNVTPSSGGPAITSTAVCILNVTGIIAVTTANNAIDVGGTASSIKVVGPITTTNAIAVLSTSTSAINILTGPFVCTTYGGMPFLIARLHYIPTSGSYFEFRDSSTNGALSPGPIASASYFYVPSTVIAAPNQNDVRFGTVYASGSQTGQMRVPLPSQVSIGVPVDNTVGTAVLSTNDIINAVWNSSITELTSSNSIGNRLKNVSTPDITANQIIGLI